MLLRILFIILLSSNCLAEYQTVKPDYQFSFPKDHGSHDNYPMEWWYFTGHLTANENRTFGFEITVFRVGLDDFRVSDSPWKSKNVFIVHTALTDDQDNKYYHQEELIRENFDLVKSSSETLDISALNHRIKLIKDQLSLSINLPNYQLNLVLQPKKPVILQGADGFSAKSKENGSASLYTSFSNLQGEGELILNHQNYPITAKVWMDHEVMGKTVNRQEAGWDWFAIQLDNNTELMLYYLKDAAGNVTNYSKGSFINHSGIKENLDLNDYQIEVLDYWKSSETQISYPALWKIKVPKFNLDLTIKPTLANQEFTSKDLSVTYWEGRSLVYQSNQVTGQAYVELVGYKKTDSK